MTWDQVENTMTMPRLMALEKQWEKMPPLAISLSYLAQAKGYKIKTKPTTQSKEEFNRALKGQ